MQRDMEKLCPPSIFHTLKVQSNQLKVIESTPTVTFGITGNTSVLNLLALYVPWGRPFCRSQGGTQKLTCIQYQHVIYHLRAKAGFLGPLRNRKGTHGICPFWGSLGHSMPRRCKHTHVGWRGNPASFGQKLQSKPGYVPSTRWAGRSWE